MSDWISELLAVQQQVRKETLFDDPIERLMQEHRIISDLTCTLEVWSIRAEEGYSVDAECMDALVSLLMEFVDGVHHEKEESILVPHLVDWGLLQEPADLHTEHQHERYLVGELRHLVGSTEHGDSLRSKRFATLARELATFQRNHLESESRGVYGLLDDLDVERRSALKHALEAFDRRKEPVLRAWRERLQRLVDRRGVATEHGSSAWA